MISSSEARQDKSPKVVIDRACLAVLTFASVFTGAWAYFAPRFFYDSFPGLGLSWLPQLGPYNEHFVKDVGAMFLALAVLSAVALRHADDGRSSRMAGAVWLVFNVLHFGYHVTMLHMYEPLDQVLNVIVLGVLIVVSVPLVAQPRADGRRAGGDRRF
ncbi:hypothetical protein [Saccharopolyspora sp. NPDC049426]|uniref:hypothetical protein n=1 Tax=Saccharopolyspora sp. NPDC049426 TaxID=3155652 RepID=UPI0034448A34